MIVVPLHRLLFATHDMTWEHVHRWQHRPRPPLLVERLPDGWWFVHDGRHRATAAYEDDATHVLAEVVR